MSRRWSNRLVWVVCVLAAMPAAVLANGIAVPVQGARSLGLAFATSTDPQDLTCIYSNPAGLSRLGKGQVFLGMCNGYADVRYTMPGEKEVGLEQHVFYLPFPGASSNFGTERFAAGIAAYAPFGARMDYPADGPQRHIIQYVDLATILVTGAMAYNVTDRLSVGLGLSYVYARIELEQTRSLYGSEVDVGAEADGTEFGWNFGVLYDLTDAVTVGLSYTAQVDGNLDGDAGIVRPKDLPFPRYDITSIEVSLPAYYRAGFTWRVNPRWKVLFDTIYWDWSVWKSNRIEMAPNPMGIEAMEFPRNWDDAVSVVVGVEHTPPGKWIFRGGLAYDQNAIPDETVDLGPADSEKFGPMLGLGYRPTAHLALDLGMGILFYQDRDINNSIQDPPTNGHYEYTMGFFGFDVGYRF